MWSLNETALTFTSSPIRLVEGMWIRCKFSSILIASSLFNFACSNSKIDISLCLPISQPYTFVSQYLHIRSPIHIWTYYLHVVFHSAMRNKMISSVVLLLSKSHSRSHSPTYFLSVVLSLHQEHPTHFELPHYPS